MEGEARGELADFGLGPYVHGTPSHRFPVYTRGNAGEVYPQPVFPLTSAMAKAFAGDSTGDFLRSTGMLTDAECDEVLELARTRVSAAYAASGGGASQLPCSCVAARATRMHGTSIRGGHAFGTPTARCDAPSWHDRWHTGK